MLYFIGRRLLFVHKYPCNICLSGWARKMGKSVGVKIIKYFGSTSQLCFFIHWICQVILLPLTSEFIPVCLNLTWLNDRGYLRRRYSFVLLFMEVCLVPLKSQGSFSFS